MTPQKFFLANANVGKPEKAGADEVEALPIFTDGTHCLTRWKLSWRERLSALFFGTAWVWIKSGKTMPPASIIVARGPERKIR